MTMAFTHFGQSTTFTAWMDGLEVSFQIIFVVEALLKLFGLGLFGYFKDDW